VYESGSIFRVRLTSIEVSVRSGVQVPTE